MLDESPRRVASVPVWVTVLLVGVAAVGGVFLAYSTLPSNQQTSDTASITTTTQTSTATQTVYLTSAGNASSSYQLGLDPVSIYQQVNGSVVTVDGFVTSNINSFFGQQTVTQEVLGSGFVLNYDGSDYVATNFHVVDSAVNITVRFWNGNAYPAKVIGTDPYSDLAVLSVPGVSSSELHPLLISPSSTLQVGQPVAAIGNPFGLSGSMTVGIVSQLGRTITEATAGNFSIAGVIQFSAPINPGNSGGPLLDSSATVVGITTAVVGGSQGVGFAIPSNTIIRELPSLIHTGKYDKHAYLGIEGTDMNYLLAQASGTNVTYGVLVEGIANGGPASAAGLRAGSKLVNIGGQQYLVGGDIIVSVNGTRIINYDSLVSYVEGHILPGQTISLGIIRSGSYQTVSLVAGTRPPPP